MMNRQERRAKAEMLAKRRESEPSPPTYGDVMRSMRVLGRGAGKFRTMMNTMDYMEREQRERNDGKPGFAETVRRSMADKPIRGRLRNDVD